MIKVVSKIKKLGFTQNNLTYFCSYFKAFEFYARRLPITFMPRLYPLYQIKLLSRGGTKFQKNGQEIELLTFLSVVDFCVKRFWHNCLPNELSTTQFTH